MEHCAKWIWYYGDYELFHSNLVNSRREEKGDAYPPFIALPSIHTNVGFEKRVHLDAPTKIHVVANGQLQVKIDNLPRHSEDSVFTIPQGEHTIIIYVCNLFGLPAAYIDGEVIYSDESWEACDRSFEKIPVGCTPAYFSESDDVEKFPFSYKKIEPVSREEVDGGFLYDFGKETFGFLDISGAKSAIDVYYGESISEALDVKDAILHEKNVSGDKIQLRQRAFRYIYLRTNAAPSEILAEYEYLPLSDIGSFSCDDERVSKIFDICAYTFHLNSREFYLDGIKRDRWVWAGDAYQSFKINPYLYFDKEIMKRTILSLLGTPPYKQHVNTINDYSFYLIISVYDYWFMTGDTEFVSIVYPKVKALYDFCVSRLDENGFVSERPGDWIFIDWSDTLDKDGPHCAEQILLWQATRCFKLISNVTHNPCDSAIDEEELREKIYRYYYKEKAGGFIDCFASGKNVINRQQNILALLYDFTDERESKRIVKDILLNDDIPELTTPYFSFFELLAFCNNGYVEIAQQKISSYWGAMVELGATSIWEEYNPASSGNGHYNMYGEPYGKSLCHAWGSGPICFLGKYVAGVCPTSVGYHTFDVQPNPGIYRKFRATVPISGGRAEVEYSDGTISVFTDCDGGTLVWKGKRYPIEKGKRLEIKDKGRMAS